MHSCLCALLGVGLEFGEELEEYVAAAVDISVEADAARGTFEDLAASQLFVNITTGTLISSFGTKLHCEVMPLSLRNKLLLSGECLDEVGHRLIANIVRHFLSPWRDVGGVRVYEE